MRTIISILLVLFAVPVRGDSAQSYSMRSFEDMDGKSFISEVTKEQLIEAPAWRSQDDFPPLSPRKADQLATAKFNELLEDRKDWRRDSISLNEIGDGSHWIYVVEFNYHGDLGGLVLPYRIIVLMDGTVVEPKFSEDK